MPRPNCCTHGRTPSTCSFCRPELFCFELNHNHKSGTRKRNCTVVNPSILCSHGVRKYTCAQHSSNAFCGCRNDKGMRMRKSNCRTHGIKFCKIHGKRDCKSCHANSVLCLCGCGSRKTNCRKGNPERFCEHERDKYACLSCRPQLVCPCPGLTRFSNCKTCSPDRFCPCGSRRHDCVRCATEQQTRDRGWLCISCNENRTKNGLCTTCVADWLNINAKTETVILCLIEKLLDFEIRTESSIFLGGKACFEQINGVRVATRACASSNGAFGDAPIVLSDRIVMIEIDEKLHDGYDMGQELHRYDILKYGSSAESVPLIIMRLGLVNREVDVDRVKRFTEAILRAVSEPLSDDANVGIDLRYYGYSPDHKHVKQTKYHTHTFRSVSVEELDSIESRDALNIDVDLNQVVKGIARDAELVSTLRLESQCAAMTGRDNTVRPCTVSRGKNTPFCSHHRYLSLREPGVRINPVHSHAFGGKQRYNDR